MIKFSALGPEPTPDCFQFRLRIEVKLGSSKSSKSEFMMTGILMALIIMIIIKVRDSIIIRILITILMTTSIRWTTKTRMVNCQLS